MILEVVRWDVKPNFTKEFEKAFKDVQTILSGMKGYKSHQIRKCIEKQNRYMLLVKWETLEDHTTGFQKSDEYQVYRNAIHEFFEPTTLLEHYEELKNNL